MPALSGTLPPMRKSYLFAPGPTPIPSEVLLAMARPIIHHRTKEFEAAFAQVREGLQWLFQTRQDVLTLASSGTGAMEAAVANVVSPGDTVLVVNGGKFGERWLKLCRTYGAKVTELKVEWGEAVDPAQIEEALGRAPADAPIRAVYLQASETSTGVAHPVRAIAEICRRREDTLCVVDAITALGVFDLQTDAWGLDIVIAGSQKALMLPPGLAFLSVSEKAWRRLAVATAPRFYFDLKRERDNQQKNQTAYTPAISLILGLRESLRLMREEGLEQIFARHHLLATATREGLIALGLTLLAARAPSDAVTAVLAPEGCDGQAIYKRLQSRYGLTAAGGQDHLKGKIFRIATMGDVGPFDVIIVLAAIEMTLKSLGCPIELGRGVRRAEELLLKAGD